MSFGILKEGRNIMSNTKDLKVDKLKVMAWGDAKSWKTTFGSTFPRPFFFDLDNGMLTLAGRDVEYETYSGADGCKKFLDDFEKVAKRDDVDTLVVDSLSSLQEGMMEVIQKQNNSSGKAPQIQEYGLYMVYIRKFLYDLVDCDKHVVLTAHEQVFQDSVTQEVFVTPLIFGKAMPRRMGMWFDEFYHTEVEIVKGEAVYYIRTKPTRKYACGSRLGCLDKLEVPDFNVIIKKAKEANKIS